MTLKASFTKKIVEFGMKRKLKEKKQENMKRKRLRFSSLRQSPMQKCQGKISKHSPGYNHVEGQWHSTD